MPSIPTHCEHALLPLGTPELKHWSTDIAESRLPFVTLARREGFVSCNPSDSIFPRPFSSSRLISRSVGLVNMGDLGYQRIIRIWVCEHGAYRKQDFRDGQSRAPLVSQDVQAYTAIGVDVRMVDAGGEVDFWWLKWIIGREVYGEEEYTSRIWTITWSHYCCLPVEKIFSNRSRRAWWRRIAAKICEFLVDSL